MMDQQELIRARLGKLGLGARREEEILRELSEHLADQAAALEARGITNEEALHEALSGVVDWSKFREEILRAETEEANLNYRTKALWLPALGALTLSSALLALFQFSGVAPCFYRVSDRLSGTFDCTFYIPWLVTLPVVGAVAAVWSRLAGGKEIHRLLAALAPPIGLLGSFLISPFITLLFYTLVRLSPNGDGQRRIPLAVHAPPVIGVLVLLVSWVLLPAVGLWLGAALFLRKPQAQS